MKKPEPAPEWQANMSAAINTVPRDIITRINNKYYYWDKLKHLPMPENVTPETVWAAVKMSRLFSQKEVPSVSDARGKGFGFWLPDAALKHLHYIDQYAGGQMLIDEPGIHSEERKRYMISSLVNEAISSSQLEGAATTRAVAKEMIKTGRKPRDRSEQMIYNNYLTIMMLKDHIQEPLTPELIYEIHAQLTKDTLDDPSWSGRFRKKEDGPIEVQDRTAEQNVLYTPPEAGRVAELMEAMCTFANEENDEEFIFPVIKGILLHFWLAWVHPFMDGNGRTARALFYWYMLKKNYWLFQYWSISTAILSARSQYDRSFLYTEIDDNDATYFIMYNLEAICKAISSFKEYIERKQQEKKNMVHVLREHPWLNSRQQALLARALIAPDETYTIETHKNVHGVTHQTARTDLLTLTERGLLEMRKEGRKFVFTPVADLSEKLEGRKS